MRNLILLLCFVAAAGTGTMACSPCSAQETEFSGRIGPDFDLKPAADQLALGYELLAKRQYALAESAFRKAGSLGFPTFGIEGLGETFLARRRFQEAGFTYLSSVQGDINNASLDVRLKYALCLYGMGKCKEAKEVYAAAVPSVLITADIGKSLIKRSFPERDVSLREFEVAVRTCSALRLLLHSGRSDLALLDAQRVLQIETKAPLAKYVVAVALLPEEPEKAIKMLEDLRRELPPPVGEELVAHMPQLKKQAEQVLKEKRAKNKRIEKQP